MYPLDLCRTAEGLAMAEKSCEEMSDRLRRANQEQQSRDVKMAAELDDLYRTKINLEERLIELIRYTITHGTRLLSLTATHSQCELCVVTVTAGTGRKHTCALECKDKTTTM